MNEQSIHLNQIVLQHEIEQFYYNEAALLDAREFKAWLMLLADDLEYWMPIRTTRTWEEKALEFAPLGGHAYYDDDKTLMRTRVHKLYTGCSWSENPPSRTRHLISNVRLRNIEQRDEVLVDSNFCVYQSRLSDEENCWFGRREDLLRKYEGSWLIVKRHIFLDHVRLSTKGLTLFF